VSQLSRTYTRSRFLHGLGLVGFLLPLALTGCGSGGGDSDDSEDVGVIEEFPDEGRQHVDPSVNPVYKTDPPTSGPHYPQPTTPGFYTEAPRPGNLVHSLEHGNIVLYYNPATVSTADTEKLRTLTTQYPGLFEGLVVVPRSDPTYPLILTAWRHRLRLRTYDQAAIDNFLDLFRGRGPEGATR
jgi:hypothetical protein